MDSSDKYCMKWNSYHKHIGSFLSKLCESEILTDVTLWAENKKFNCHRVILSACSPYFQEILSNAASKHPVVVLTGIHAEDVKTIIHFIYHGELDNITYDRFISVLKTAEILKICGLTEVIEHIPPRKCLEDLGEIKMMDDSIHDCSETLQEVRLSKTSEDTVQRKQKTKKCQRKYSEGSLGWALSDMEKGMPLVEAARLHKIPRSTLYAKAKQHSGLSIASRKEHTNQDCQAAVQAVAGGLSLKRAAEQYGIPKTVLWRKVQKRMDICTNLNSRRKKQERNLKLEDIDKNIRSCNDVNLISQSRITGPSEKLNTFKTLNLDCESNNESNKQYRLTQALNACKEGKMSQAVASRTFQVPKTLIWRRLQKAWSVNKNDENTLSDQQVKCSSSAIDTMKEANDAKYISVLANVENYGVNLANEDVKSSDENNKFMDNNKGQFTEAPLIILTSANEALSKQELDHDDELMESLNVRIENVVEVVSDKEDIQWP